ncbi:hypothetical protein [Agrobacterium tumefaciens]|uniref:hypothetical protein n=1 Tax=Agrobacterium tumefaciens TaxID=358 RepID=UPI000DCF746A|nr:hypothetical protein [Agrobacterium tumefaciens]TCV46104.1 hypothetical protein EDB97_11812 [Agrobacterium tumefaciens]
MIDRRSFLICGAASTVMPMPAIAKAESILPPADAWERSRREMGLFIGILRENRTAIIELENDPSYTESARRQVHYVRSLTVDHCAKMIEHLATESRRNADALLIQSSDSKCHIAGV